MIFDSHAHLVSDDVAAYPPSALTGKLTPGEYDDPMTAQKLVAAMAAAGVAMACAVQRAHVYGYNNRYVLDSVAVSGGRLRAVPVLDSRDPATPKEVTRLAREEGIAGLRFSSPTFPATNAEWIDSDAAKASWRACLDNGLPVCIHTLHVQREFVVPLLVKAANLMPALTIVVDHVGGAHASHVEQRFLAAQGKQPVAATPAELQVLADCPNLVMKVSTINLESEADPAAFMSALAAQFGAERLIWGSDVGQSRADYAGMVRLALDAVSTLPEAAARSILHDNAMRIYGPEAS